MIEIVSPVGHPRASAQAPRRLLETLGGRSVGFIWNQYQATRNFWPRLEQALQDLCQPRAVQRAYKTNTWSPLDKERFRELARSVDYMVVGVGA